MTTTTNHEISLADAIDLTHRFQATRPANYPVCETFDMDAVTKMLSVTGASSMRIYLGQDDAGNVVTVLTAADSQGEDILPTLQNSGDAANADSGDNPVILEDGFRCPQDCPSNSPLISS